MQIILSFTILIYSHAQQKLIACNVTFDGYYSALTNVTQLAHNFEFANFEMPQNS